MSARVHGEILYPVLVSRAGAIVRFTLEAPVRFENAVVPKYTVDAAIGEDDEIDVSLIPGSYLVVLPDGQEFPGIELTEGMDALLADLLWPLESYPSSSLFPSEDLFPIAA